MVLVKIIEVKDLSQFYTDSCPKAAATAVESTNHKANKDAV
jgi:hypothetical protein